MSIRFGLSVAIVLVAVFFFVKGRRLRRDDYGGFIFLLLVTLIPSVWAPQLARDIVLSLGLAVVASFAADSAFGKLVWATCFGGILFGLSRLVPGGATVIILIITLIALAVFGHEAWTHLRRLARAQTLRHDQTLKHEVEIGGTVRATAPPEVPPGFDASEVAAWYVVGNQGLHGPSYAHLETETGSVLLEMATIQIEDASYRHTNVEAEDGSSTATAANAADPEHAGKPADAEEHKGGGADALDKADMLVVIEEGKDAYVIGKPTWVRAAEGIAGYRQAPMVPVFGEGCTVYLVSEAEIDARTLWHLSLAIGFSAACGLVLLAQALERFL